MIVLYMMEIEFQVPEPVLRFAVSREQLSAQGVVLLSGEVKDYEWNADSIDILKTLLPLHTIENGKFKINYNFTHLSHIFKVPKVEIYKKLMELYYSEDESNLNVKEASNNAGFIYPRNGDNETADISLSPRKEATAIEQSESDMDSARLNLMKMKFKTDTEASELRNESVNSIYNSEVESDTNSEINIGTVSQYFHSNKFDKKPSQKWETPVSEEASSNNSLESLLLEEEVLKQI